MELERDTAPLTKIYENGEMITQVGLLTSKGLQISSQLLS